MDVTCDIHGERYTLNGRSVAARMFSKKDERSWLFRREVLKCARASSVTRPGQGVYPNKSNNILVDALQDDGNSKKKKHYSKISIFLFDKSDFSLWLTRNTCKIRDTFRDWIIQGNYFFTFKRIKTYDLNARRCLPRWIFYFELVGHNLWIFFFLFRFTSTRANFELYYVKSENVSQVE